MLATVIGVVLGGVITIATQVILDHASRRAARVAHRREVLSLLQVQVFYLYSAQHLFREALQTGHWWPAELASLSMPPGQELREMASILPTETWRFYTGAVRRTAACLAIRGSALGRNETDVSVDNLQRLLGAFVTLDEAHRRMVPLLGAQQASEVELRGVALASEEIADGLRRHAGILVPQEVWIARFQSLNG